MDVGGAFPGSIASITAKGCIITEWLTPLHNNNRRITIITIDVKDPFLPTAKCLLNSPLLISYAMPPILSSWPPGKGEALNHRVARLKGSVPVHILPRNFCTQ